jgi:hypothetical protein
MNRGKQQPVGTHPLTIFVGSVELSKAQRSPPIPPIPLTTPEDLDLFFVAFVLFVVNSPPSLPLRISFVRFVRFVVNGDVLRYGLQGNGL